jgi:hypothetical protein
MKAMETWKPNIMNDKTGYKQKLWTLGIVALQFVMGCCTETISLTEKVGKYFIMNRICSHCTV